MLSLRGRGEGAGPREDKKILGRGESLSKRLEARSGVLGSGLGVW